MDSCTGNYLLYQFVTTENLYTQTHGLPFFFKGKYTICHTNPWDAFMSYASWCLCEHSLKADTSTFNHSIIQNVKEGRGGLVPKGSTSGTMDGSQARTGCRDLGNKPLSQTWDQLFYLQMEEPQDWSLAGSGADWPTARTGTGQHRPSHSGLRCHRWSRCGQNKVSCRQKWPNGGCVRDSCTTMAA